MGEEWARTMVRARNTASKQAIPEHCGGAVSDGGHLENLGVYELLRRRCKLIISVDGEADSQLGFNSLVTLLRFARIDMGISIDIKLDELRHAEHASHEHWAVGEIDYGGGERGTLLYLKSTLTGDESPYIRAYREAQPAFPHESTANKFFTETQLEVYRVLGEHIADSEPLRQEMAKALGLTTASGAVETQPGSQRTTVAAWASRFCICGSDLFVALRAWRAGNL